jgi:hypothetical protein
MDASLTDLYADLKKDVENPIIKKPMLMPDESSWRNKTNIECDKLKDACYKRILLDIYAKVVPLDSSYVAGNMGVMKDDIDSFLQSKNMSATEYLKSCRESTKAPLLEFVIRSCNNIGKAFMEEAEETLKDAKANNINAPLPMADPDTEEINNQLVDVQNDDEYETFVDKLKKKTIDKIVDDVSTIINKKKEVDDLSFNPKSTIDSAPEFESVISVAIDHIAYQLMKENIDITEDLYDDMIGLAIREATLNLIDRTFKQPMSDIKTFSSKIMYNKGSLINESGMISFLESKGKKKDQDPPKVSSIKKNKSLDFVPFKKIGDIRFGSTRESIRKKLGEPKEFKKTKSSKNKTDDFGYCHVFYNTDDKCEAVEVFNDVKVIFDDRNIMGIAVGRFVKHCDAIKIKDSDYISRKNGIVAHAEDNIIKSILVVDKSYIAFYKDSEKKPIKESASNNDTQLTSKEREFFKDKFPDAGCSFHKDGKGYFCKTHRTRSKSHEKMESLTKKEVDFVSSTS